MQNPHVIQHNIAKSTTFFTTPIALIRTRTLFVSLRAKFNSSATGNAELEVYTSPDGKNWDTNRYGFLTLDVSAGNEVQESAYVVCPEHGFIKFGIKNLDASYALTFGKLWYSIQSHPGDPQHIRGSNLDLPEEF